MREIEKVGQSVEMEVMATGKFAGEEDCGGGGG